jgi:sarcosine oxidase subunit gamma
VADENVFEVGATMAGHYGAAATGVTLAETTFAGAWNVQGNAGDPAFDDAVRETFGLSLSAAPNTATRDGALTALWLGPRSWLIVASDEPTIADFESRRDAVNAASGALFDVTASRVAWTIAGPHAATVLAKGCPLDFHPRAFGEGACAQSVFGHVNALFYRRAASSVFTLMVARSLARDAWHSLCRSAAQYGYDILRPRAF